MKKKAFAILATLLALSFSGAAGALTVNSENYWGGTVVNYSQQDVIGPDFPVDSLSATAVGGSITVVLTGAYFNTNYAKGLVTVNDDPKGEPGDLYISSTGWRVISPADNARNDIFDPALEGWDYVVKYNPGGNTNLYKLSGPYTPTGDENYWYSYRTNQAFAGGYGEPISSATSTLGAGTLTFTFVNTFGWDPEKIGYHWTMACGNDVVEGGGTPVPEPGTLILLGLGVLGVAVCRVDKK